MEANLNVQANTIVNLDRGRPPIANANTVSSPAPVATPPTRPSAANVTAAPPVRGSIVPSVDILSAHPTVSQRITEDLVSLDIPVPYDDSEITESVIDRYVRVVNEALAPSFFRLHASIHEATNRVMVQVIDTNTDEILRELPPESRLDIIARMQEFAGLLYDERS